ncbi:MAG: alginate lyase family protein [Pricia sp.]
MKKARTLCYLLFWATLSLNCQEDKTGASGQGNSKEANPEMVENRNEGSSFTYLDSRKMETVKSKITAGDASYLPAYEKLIREADKALPEGPFSVMDKTQTAPSGDKHDYLSLAPYWWPDPEKADGLPWLRKDGEVNPLTKGDNVDDPAKDTMLSNLNKLALAYYFSDDQKYAEKCIELLQTWFISPDTRMNPNLNYAQGVPGLSEGRGFGIIEFAGVSRVITAIEILEPSKAMDEKTVDGLRLWLQEYLEWLQTSELGLFEKSRLNNHGTLYDVQVVGLLLFFNKHEEAKTILEQARSGRIASHIEPDGSQPEELKRTKSLSYSILNLSGLTDLAYFGKKLGVDLWSYNPPEGGSIRQAYEFLYPYAAENETWKRQQLGDLQSQVERLQRLFVKTGSRFEVDRFFELRSKTSSDTNIEQLLYPCLD